MDMHPNKYWGVITGDFIGFSNLDRSVRRRMPQMVVDAGNSLCGAIGPVMPWDVDVFRGDGWQALLSDPVSALRAALYFRAYMISSAGGDHVDMRMGIGIGPVDYVPAGKVSAGDGPAYRVSGKLLEKMGSPRQGKIRCALAKGEKIKKDMSACALDEDLLDVVVRLAATIGDTWRSRRARAMIGALGGWSQARIAENWPEKISRQAVGKHLQGAGWHALSHALDVFESKIACLTSCS
jgi:hypothetical protein